jgi:hypothetical protein
MGCKAPDFTLTYVLLPVDPLGRVIHIVTILTTIIGIYNSRNLAGLYEDTTDAAKLLEQMFASVR